MSSVFGGHISSVCLKDWRGCSGLHALKVRRVQSNTSLKSTGMIIFFFLYLLGSPMLWRSPHFHFLSREHMMRRWRCLERRAGIATSPAGWYRTTEIHPSILRCLLTASVSLVLDDSVRSALFCCLLLRFHLSLHGVPYGRHCKLRCIFQRRVCRLPIRLLVPFVRCIFRALSCFSSSTIPLCNELKVSSAYIPPVLIGGKTLIDVNGNPRRIWQ